MTMHIGRSRRFAGHRQAQINSKGVGGAVKFARCGGMPSEWASSYRREPLPPLRYKKYQNSSGLTHLEGATGMHKQYVSQPVFPLDTIIASVVSDASCVCPSFDIATELVGIIPFFKKSFH
jgi:hypothetical protein